MNATTLQALRRLLFFQIAEAAALISGTSERAWKHWESGARPVPDDVADRIRELADWRQSAIDTAADAIEQQLYCAAPAARLPIVWYVSMADWPGEPALWRPQQSACAALAGEFIAVVLVPFDGAVYARWLAGRADSESLRAAWAASLHA